MSEGTADLPDFDAAWNYGAPIETREAFEGFLDGARAEASLAWVLELKTQIARTHSLAGAFDKAHEVLDTVEPAITTDMTRVRVRYLLERGRTFNSAGEKEKAHALFIEAWELGKKSGDDFFAVDAAHMVAIAASDEGEANRWNLIGLEHARQSSDERARGWTGSLTNNMGWTAFDAGKPGEALALFEESRDHFLGRELPDRARIARWSIARVKRQQGAIDEALAMQLAIRDENETAGEPDGFCFEELGELYLLKDDVETAAENFAHAHALLSLDDRFVKNEAARLARIETLSQ
jgi:tetratricopeptide (TPR) repeat protein